MSLRHLVLPMLAACALPGAEITLAGGQVIQGEIVDRTDGWVTIDVDSHEGEIRMKLAESRIAKVDGAEPAPASEPAAPAPLAGSPHGTYAELQIRGVVGKEIRAQGVQEAILAARRLGLRHLVFVINTTAAASNADEALAIAAVLAKHRSSMQYHALIEQGIGSGLVFALHAHSLHLMPGAKVGGDRAAVAAADDEALALRADLAYRAAAFAAEAGKSGDLFAAMIDPRRHFCAWRDAQGVVVTGPERPDTIAADAVLAEDADDQVLVLTAEQFVAAGMPLIEAAAGIGAAIGQANWQDRGQGPAKAYADGNAVGIRRAENAASDTQRRIEQVASRRDKAHQVLLHSIEQARTNDPAKGDYKTVQATSGGGGTWYRHGGHVRPPVYRRDDGSDGSTYDTHLFTGDSRKEWVWRTDTTLRFLNDALSAAKSLEKLDPAAVELGMDPIFAVGEISQIIGDLRTAIDRVTSQRNRKGE